MERKWPIEGNTHREENGGKPRKMNEGEKNILWRKGEKEREKSEIKNTLPLFIK